ncbi:hypothetical protein [Chloroflexus sp.]|uniref:hypothetical protein n=1 Tax=Chloroflexus sp. TaxID=1904827 RepID=UPI002ADE3BB5|nr:hypothetical protein [Chloroflexus sp.]
MIIIGAIFVGVGLVARDWMVPSSHLSASGVVVDLDEVRSSRGSTGYKAWWNSPPVRGRLCGFKTRQTVILQPIVAARK